MKTVSVRDLQKSLRRRVDESQKERVVVTRRGHPAAVLIGVEGLDWEQVLLQMDDSFWRMLQRRRRQRTSPLAAVRRRLGAPESP
ncbi:MAG: type II toxin-antitoxin system Phd/YefM family antitoxin [Planctomycetaceae bacterium]|nr:type II toxin-antitoxin system Phd/YefM family antitoxin [Planctomycetota bacterium]NUN51747.1 type II toxin-antitoxin system Phd/YefM family antitoxin [Planctomycetaceae bacterium]